MPPRPWSIDLSVRPCEGFHDANLVQRLVGEELAPLSWPVRCMVQRTCPSRQPLTSCQLKLPGLLPRLANMLGFPEGTQSCVAPECTSSVKKPPGRHVDDLAPCLFLADGRHEIVAMAYGRARSAMVGQSKDSKEAKAGDDELRPVCIIFLGADYDSGSAWQSWSWKSRSSRWVYSTAFSPSRCIKRKCLHPNGAPWDPDTPVVSNPSLPPFSLHAVAANRRNASA